MGLKIKLTENELRNFVRKVVNKRLFEDMNMDQYSEFNYDELAQRLEQDLKEYGIIDAGQTNGMDRITLEFPNEWYITLEFNFNDDGSIYYVYIETDETDKDIIRLTGTPYYEIYRIGEGNEFDYNTLLEYVKEILDKHNRAMDSKGQNQNEAIIRGVMKNVKKHINEVEETQYYYGDSLEDFDFNIVATELADTIENMMEHLCDKELYTTANIDLYFRDESSISASVDIYLYSTTTYSWDGDYYSPPESRGYNRVSIDEPSVTVYDPDGTEWSEDEVKKLNIDWSPLDELECSKYTW